MRPSPCSVRWSVNRDSLAPFSNVYADAFVVM
jgi:hypothetical protein